MKKESLKIEGIPAIIWGDESDKVYIYVHGKMASKEDAQDFANKAFPKGYQVLSFDLPEHGDRKNENYPCMVWNGVNDLAVIGCYVHQRWNDISVCGCSLGAYFSLLAYKTLPIKKCLFLSPILNMERLMQNMMKLFDISEELLKKKRKIPTPMDETLYWDYYCYVRENPIEKWNVPTTVLYGSEDNLTERVVVENFSKQFGCDLSVLEGGEHWFHTEKQVAFLDEWFDKNM
ncbi:MAG: alpha/beta hydrolase [Oscillospiraceae bacterium]|nr:alpha/beta hydrolase [Oscillospiraceae bacterium]